MNETEFQALFDLYDRARRSGAENPIPQKLHLLVYNYARLRHQQTSDVSADFYLHVAGKLSGILERYDPRRLPFYQYMASALNFEFSHFLQRRKMPRSQIELLSVEELSERRLELEYKENRTSDLLSPLMEKLQRPLSLYARLALAAPLTVGELLYLMRRRRAQADMQWRSLRAYRTFLRYAEEKRTAFLRERDRLLSALMRIDDAELKASSSDLAALRKRRESTRRRFFSMDTRIPIRIVADVTGDSIATTQRKLKEAFKALKSVYEQWEKQTLLDAGKKTKRQPSSKLKRLN